jgi:FkbM family methyltransferase
VLRRLAAHLLGRVPPAWRTGLGRIPLADAVVRRVSHRLSPPGARLWLEVERGPARGLRLRLDPRFESDFWRGRYEGELQERLASTLRPGWTVYDVGAQIGFVSLLCGRLVGPDGAVYAFEPDPSNFAQLAEHVDANGAANVHARNAAVWSSTGAVTFSTDETHPVRFTGRVEEGGPGTTVPATTIDEFAARNRPPDVMKIDVEGGEEAVLAGAARVLAEARPIVFCEVHLEGGAEAGRLDRIRALLTAAGYEVEHVAPDDDPTHVLARHPAAQRSQPRT